jgi:hypothetical protein
MHNYVYKKTPQIESIECLELQVKCGWGAPLEREKYGLAYCHIGKTVS